MIDEDVQSIQRRIRRLEEEADQGNVWGTVIAAIENRISVSVEVEVWDTDVSDREGLGEFVLGKSLLGDRAAGKQRIL